MPRTFAALFDCPAEAAADAPGRVNLIGEHTDYNGGFVLPAAIPQRTRVEVAARGDRTVRLWSAQFPDTPPVCFALGSERRGLGWADYVQGLTALLPPDAIRGFDARIESGVPVGSGLSSSAALQVAVGRALSNLFGLGLESVPLARLCQRAEVEFVGAPVGIMDQMACSLADTTAALFLDTRSLEYARVPLPPGTTLVVLDSGVSHDHASGDYRVRRAECDEAARRLGVPELRDAGDLAALDRLPPLLARRARHVMTENARVGQAVEALRAGDPRRVGALFRASHRSMRDDFAVSIDAIDRLVEIAEAEPAIYGARLTGGGFGGSIVALADAGGAVPAARRIVAAYRRETGHPGKCLVPPPPPADQGRARE